MKQKELTADSVWREYEKMLAYNDSIQLDDTVRVNENFFIGKQWEGVESNGLPTPQFNFLKRVTLFTVASITSDKLKLHVLAPALGRGRPGPQARRRRHQRRVRGALRAQQAHLAAQGVHAQRRRGRRRRDLYLVGSRTPTPATGGTGPSSPR